MKRKLALLLPALLLAGGFSGCANEEAVIYENPASAQNDGQAASLVIGAYDLDGDYKAALEEIILRYQADFPETAVRIEKYAGEAEMAQAAANGEADLFQVRDEDQPGYVERGLLADMMEYTGMWDYEASLTEGARRAMRSMGEDFIYTVPVDIEQDAFFYRADWVEAYNETRKGTERAYVETWEQLADASAKLGGQGKLAVSADRTSAYFDAMLWSDIAQGGVADPAAAYFLRGGEGTTVFASDKAPAAAELFAKVMGTRLAADMTEDEAVEAFIEGKAGMLLASAATAQKLAGAMPEGTWKAAGIPQGAGEMAVFHNRWWGWGVSAASADGEKAIHFLSYLTNSDNSTHLAKVCGVLPLYKEALMMEPSLLEGDRAAEIAMLKDAAVYRYAYRPKMYQANESFEPVLEEALEDYLDGKLTTQALLEGLDGYWAQAYAEEGMLWAEDDE